MPDAGYQISDIRSQVWGIRNLTSRVVALSKRPLVFEKSELELGEMKTVGRFLSRVLVVNLDGEFYAISNHCTHLGCSLARGKLDHYIITCPCHGSQFDVRTGKVVAGPARKPVRVYSLKVEDSKVIIRK